MNVPVFETDKKIALGFSCHNNTEAEITRSLDPWVDHVDYIIAVEGRYRVPYSPAMMKGPIPPKFGKDTREILGRHYGSKVIYIEYYGVQYEKRQQYLNAARDCDAVIVWDSDDIIINSREFHPQPHEPDWQRFHKLIALAHEFAEDRAGTLDMWAWIPSEELWPRQFNKIESNTWHRYHRIHLNPGKQKYILNHYTVAENHITEEQILGFSTKPENLGQFNPYLIYPMGTAEGVRFTTDRKLRTEEANNAGNLWSWQLMQEETYRAYLVEAKVNGWDKVYKEQYREPFTYWFDETGRPVMYTKEEQELFNQLEL